MECGRACVVVLFIVFFDGSFTAPSSNGGSQRNETLLPAPVSERCKVCYNTVTRLYDVYNTTRSPTELRNAVVDLCLTSKSYNSVVCSGMTDVYLNMMVFFAEHAANAAVINRLCTLYLKDQTCSPDVDWRVDADLGNKPNSVIPSVPDTLDDPVTIVHVSDLHYDPRYSPGNEVPCEEPLCCRRPQQHPGNQSGGAGYWGDYRVCDMPLWTIRTMLQHIRHQHTKIDYVYYTGDFVDHAVWEDSRQYNADIITKVVELFNETFGTIPVFFALGNGEPAEKNSYAPLNVSDAVSTRYLFELVSNLWSPYITPEAQQTILRGGFYTVVPRPGFRVIVLNSAVCFNSNYWLAYDPRDPYGQLKWLVSVLHEAEAAHEKVHILYHVPSGWRGQYGWCLKVWGREFHKIVDRFENTVTAHFVGHTHFEEFHVFYCIKNSSRPNGVSFISGSGTPFISVNPSYKVYTIDPTSWHVLDAVTWAFNLTAANQDVEEEPDWFRLYSLREEYGLQNLLPAQMDSLVHRMAEDHGLIRKYARNYVKKGDPMLAQGCDDSCLKTRLCEIVTVETGDLDKCEELMREFDAANRTQPATA